MRYFFFFDKIKLDTIDNAVWYSLIIGNIYLFSKGGEKMSVSKATFNAKSPLNMSGSVFDVSNWVGGILWVVMFGIIVSMGSKALNVIDARVPGSQTPNMKPYQQVNTGSGINII